MAHQHYFLIYLLIKKLTPKTLINLTWLLGPGVRVQDNQHLHLKVMRARWLDRNTEMTESRHTQTSATLICQASFFFLAFIQHNILVDIMCESFSEQATNKITYSNKASVCLHHLMCQGICRTLGGLV